MADTTGQILQQARTFDYTVAIADSRPLNCFGGVLDVEELLSIFREESLQIKAEFGQEALEMCAQLERSKITQEEFLDVMKEYCTWTKSAATAIAVTAHAVPVIGGLFGLWKALLKTSNSIKERSKAAREKLYTAELQQRYLKGLAAANHLSVETTKIAAIVQEMISRGFDDYETINLNASSTATIQLLKEDYLPYLRRLHASNGSQMNMVELRQKRNELKQRLIRQYEIVNVHYSRIEQGIWEMRMDNAMYFLKTNRLPAFARESLLEVHLRAWYTIMGFLDAESTMADQDEYNVGTAATEKVHQIQSLFEHYAMARRNLLHTRHESKRVSRGISKHDHAFFIIDYGVEHDVLFPKVSVKDFMLKWFPNIHEPEGGSIDFNPDNSCEIWNDTMFSREDRCSVLGKRIENALRDHISAQLYIQGPVWSTNFNFIDKLRPSNRLIEVSTPADDRPPLPVRRSAP